MEKPRITGTEMEWSVMTQTLPGMSPRQIDKQVLDMLLSRFLSEDLPSIHGFGQNGARIYRDVGNQLEYATPEDTSFIGTVANEMAGERLAYRLLCHGTEETERRPQKFLAFNLNKRVIDQYGTTWGYHESYCCDSTKFDVIPIAPSEKNNGWTRLTLYALHLATRNLYTGAGAVVQKGTDGRRVGSFAVAQKALSLEEALGNGTTRKKPVVSLRDEPHADINSYFRIHVTSGDPHMSPWASWMQLGTTSLVLRMMEHGVDIPRLRFKHFELPRMARIVATDPNMRQAVNLESGSIRPLDIQILLMQGAQELSQRVRLPAEEIRVLEEWEKACSDLESHARRLQDRVEWIAKKIVLEHAMEKENLGWESEQIATWDRQWDRIGDENNPGIGQSLRQRGWQQWMPAAELITERMTSPPPTTRARLRGAFIKAYTKPFRHPDTSANWDSIKYSETGRVPLRDPYATENPRLSVLLAPLQERQIAG